MTLDEAIKVTDTPGWEEYVTWRWRHDISKQPEEYQRVSVEMRAYGYAAGYKYGKWQH